MMGPVLQVVVRPENPGDQGRLEAALAGLMLEISNFGFYTDQSTGDTIVAAMSEADIGTIIDRLIFEHGVCSKVGKLQVAYRETVRVKASAEGRFIRQTDGQGQYGHCWIEIEPLPAGSGFVFECRVVDGAIPSEFIRACELGVREGLFFGVLAGYPVVDVKVALIDGSYHEVDSNLDAYKKAGLIAFRDAMKKAHPVLKEPIMRVEVTTPETIVGDVVGDINRREGRIVNLIIDDVNGVVVRAQIPLSRMLGYEPDLRALTLGRAEAVIEASHYDQVPVE